jgi:hypothetical protein
MQKEVFRMTQQSEKLLEKFQKAKWMVEQQAKAVERELGGQYEDHYKRTNPKKQPQYRKNGL